MCVWLTKWTICSPLIAQKQHCHFLIAYRQPNPGLYNVQHTTISGKAAFNLVSNFLKDKTQHFLVSVFNFKTLFFFVFFSYTQTVQVDETALSGSRYRLWSCNSWLKYLVLSKFHINTKSVVKRANQRIYLLRTINSQGETNSAYWVFVQHWELSHLFIHLLVWWLDSLSNIVKVCFGNIKTQLSGLNSLWEKYVFEKAKCIMPFELTPPGRRYPQPITTLCHLCLLLLTCKNRSYHELN